MTKERTRRTVVVGVDGSEDALRAVRWAAPEAQRRGVPLRLVNAFGWADNRAVGHRLSEQGFGEVLGRVANESPWPLRRSPWRRRRESRWSGRSPPVTRFDVLRAESRRARLLVLGDRGMGRLDAVAAGSVAVAVTTHADCPVVVVRGDLSPARCHG